MEKYNAVMKMFELSGKLLVTFTKKDGTSRVMRCTRDMTQVPQEKHPKGTGNKEVNYEVIPVFDLDKQEWRSFRVDSITNIVII